MLWADLEPSGSTVHTTLPWKLLTTIFLLTGLVSTPVSYRGGATEPHPHMFLQLWIDASTGSFSHQGHLPRSRHDAMDDMQVRPVELDEIQGPIASAFVVSDIGMVALLAPEPPIGQQPAWRSELSAVRGGWPDGLHQAPEPPPPRR